MTRVAFESARAHHLSNTKTKKGIDLFEKYIGRIEWLHPEEQKYKIRGTKKYKVINKSGETVFEANKITDIAKEFCTSNCTVSKCLNLSKLLKERYMIVRCENE